MSYRSASLELKFPELVFGLVGPIGVDMDLVQDALSESLSQVRYDSQMIHLTKLLESYDEPLSIVSTQTTASIYSTKIDRARAFCMKSGNGAAMAALAVSEIVERRKSILANRSTAPEDGYLSAASTAYIIRQLKRIEEIEFLRNLYGHKFIQISVTADKDIRIDNLTRKLSRDHPGWQHDKLDAEARRLIITDEDEHDSDGQSTNFGQRIGGIFHMADFFAVCSNRDHLKKTIDHCIRAFFGENNRSPTRDEFGAYMAAAASLRSVDLSRQVGAAIVSKEGDIIAVGCNEVPKAGGGNYWFEDSNKARDVEQGAEQNSVEKQRIIVDFYERLQKAGLVSTKDDSSEVDFRIRLDSALEDSLISDITEYGRMTHAEMSAICDAARLGRSLKDSVLHVTTFPCHNCAKHIVASGIQRVVFIEPYPKSRASHSHKDSILIGSPESNKVQFSHFEGISPRRYRDIFQKTGKRRSGSEVNTWFEKEPRPRIPFKDGLHVDREANAVSAILGTLIH